jgi:hypothetical protein
MKELDTLIALGVQFAILSLFAIGGAMAVEHCGIRDHARHRCHRVLDALRSTVDVRGGRPPWLPWIRVMTASPAIALRRVMRVARACPKMLQRISAVDGTPFCRFCW